MKSTPDSTDQLAALELLLELVELTELTALALETATRRRQEASRPSLRARLRVEQQALAANAEAGSALLVALGRAGLSDRLPDFENVRDAASALTAALRPRVADGDRPAAG